MVLCASDLAVLFFDIFKLKQCLALVWCCCVFVRLAELIINLRVFCNLIRLFFPTTIVLFSFAFERTHGQV
jgi:hypothetical protein